MLSAVALGLAGTVMLGTGLRRRVADEVFISILVLVAAIAEALRAFG
jgi:hypothetical protein